MTFSWRNETSEESVVDRVITCRVNDRIVGKLHYYEGVGYFAYFLEQRLNQSPLRLREAMASVQAAYVARVEQRRQST